MISSRRSSHRSTLLAATAALLLGGCAGAPALPTAATRVELTTVPFFPQTDYQCGPAALATLLVHAGVATDPEQLVPQVYVAGLHGSLQAELLGATRRHGVIPYVLAAEPAALFRELDSGRPVLVLQNFGLPRVPVWHYAVVVGFDPERNEVVLRSGTEQRRTERSPRFLRSWQRGDFWAFVALEPGQIPVTATPALYVRALAAAEPLLAAPRADAAFAAALTDWPDDELVLFAAAGHRLATHDLPAAAALYRRVLAVDARHAAARNNLANVLGEQGCNVAALAEARTALEALTPDSELYAAVRDTVQTLERTPADAPNAQCASP